MPAKIRGEASVDIDQGSLPAVARSAGFRYTGADVGGPSMFEALKNPVFLESLRKQLAKKTTYDIPDSAKFHRMFGGAPNYDQYIDANKPRVRLEYLLDQAKDVGGGMLDMLRQSLPLQRSKPAQRLGSGSAGTRG